MPASALLRSLNLVAVATQAGIAILGARCCVIGLATGLAVLGPAYGAGQESLSSPKAPVSNSAKASPSPPGIEQLKAAPDDGELLKRFVNERSRAAIGLLPQDPNGAERLLSELRGLVKSLQPRTAAGKRQITEALAAIEAYGKRVEIARVDLAHFRDKLAANPNQPEVIHRYFDKLAMEVYSLARTDAVAARKLLDDSVAFGRALREKLTDKEAQRQYEQSTRRIERLEATVGSSQRLAKLLGEPAAPLSVESWAHGQALSAESLAGKIVLLDFWAVWCSPCVASLPKLEEWHQRWSSKGLVIIGLTQYYNFSWDERAERPVRAEGKVAPEQERAMLARFAKQQHIQHRIAIEDKDAKLSKHYRVSGIPHTVLIDQTGKVRLVRVGSGLKNARDIEKLLTELLGPGVDPKPDADKKPDADRKPDADKKPDADRKSDANPKPRSNTKPVKTP